MRSLMTVTSSTDQDAPARSVGDPERLELEAVVRAYRAGVRVACFTEDSDDGQRGTLLRQDDRGFARQRSWIQYGKGQTGVCLILDRRKLITAAEQAFGDRVIARSVTYPQGFSSDLHRAELADFDNPRPRAHFVRWVIPALFSKNADWSAEREFRLVVSDWHDSPCELPLDGVVTGVVLGVAFEAHRIPLARAISNAFGVEKNACILTFVNQVLVAMPVIGRDGEWHRWTDQELRQRNLLFSS
jgi:hypothetical protein